MEDNNSAGRIIFLNGPSCSGKTTLAKQLQHVLPEPYVHISVDHFIGFLPEDRRDWSQQENFRTLYKLISGMHRCVGTLAEAGNNLIVDTVLANDDNLAECIFVLAHLQVTFVGVYCNVDEAERRELARGTSRIGQTREQATYVHSHETYDIKVDTSTAPPQSIAAKIVEFHQGNPWPQAFRQIRNDLLSIHRVSS